MRGVDYDVDQVCPLSSHLSFRNEEKHTCSRYDPQVVTFSDWYHTASDVIVGALNTAAGFQGVRTSLI